MTKPLSEADRPDLHREREIFVAAPLWVALLAARAGALSPRGRLAWAAALGTLSVLALPPIGLAPVLWIAFPGLALLLEGARTRRGAFAVGWTFGFAYFFFGLYWINASLFVDLGRYWWLLPFSATGLPIGFALFTGTATWAASYVPRSALLARLAALAAALSITEWLRGHLLTGFPWNLVGYSWTDWPSIIQSVAYIGIYGLTALTIVAALTPAALLHGRKWIALSGVLLILVMAALGAWRLSFDTHAIVEGVRLRLLQPNIAQTLKWQPDELRRNFQRHLELARDPAEPAPTIVIWPETAVPFLIEQEPEVRKVIAWATPPGGLTLTGALRKEGTQYFNSLVALNAAGDVVAHYDKAHLVPFGEYMPLRKYLPLNSIAAGDADFGSGPGPQTIDLPGVPGASPLICYEAIFPDEVVDPAHRPGWLLNVTNDGWFGRTAGPHQHFAQARVRGVEQGLPLVRAANTGISAIVDPFGRTVASLGLGKEGVVDGDLPTALPPTFYARYGDLPFAGLVLILCGMVLAYLTQRKRPR